MQRTKSINRPELADGANCANVSFCAAPRSAFDLHMIYRALITAYIHQDCDKSSPDKAQKDNLPQRTTNS
jgi:hypothetical protein